MRLLAQCLTLVGVLFTLLMMALYVRAWWAWICLFLVIFLTWSFLCFLGRLVGGVVCALRQPRPGSYETADAVLQPMFDASLYQIHVHGQWPTHPVLFCVNSPNEPLEYLYFSLVAARHSCPLSVMSKDRTGRTDYLNKFMDGIFDPKVNHISVRREGGSFEDVRKQLHQHVIQNKRSVYFYPSGAQYKAYQFEPFRTGVFKIAAEYGIPVVPLVFSHLNSLRNRAVHICIGRELVSNQHEELVAHGQDFFMRKMALLKSGRHPMEE